MLRRILTVRAGDDSDLPRRRGSHRSHRARDTHGREPTARQQRTNIIIIIIVVVIVVVPAVVLTLARLALRNRGVHAGRRADAGQFLLVLVRLVDELPLAFVRDVHDVRADSNAVAADIIVVDALGDRAGGKREREGGEDGGAVHNDYSDCGWVVDGTALPWDSNLDRLGAGCCAVEYGYRLQRGEISYSKYLNRANTT